MRARHARTCVCTCLMHMHMHVRMGGACPRVRPDPGWLYRHSRARNARGSQCICPCCTRAPARECQGVRPAALRVSRSAPSRGPVSRCVPCARQWVQTPNTNGEDLLTACRRYTKHGTLRSWGYLTPNPPVINLCMVMCMGRRRLRESLGDTSLRARGLMPLSIHGWGTIVNPCARLAQPLYLPPCTGADPARARACAAPAHPALWFTPRQGPRCAGATNDVRRGWARGHDAEARRCRPTVRRARRHRLTPGCGATRGRTGRAPLARPVAPASRNSTGSTGPRP